MPKKYIVYDNDLKFKKLRKIDVNNAIFHNADVEHRYHNVDLDTIDYRLKECVNNNFSYLDMSHLNLITFPNILQWKHFDKVDLVKCLFINNNELQSTEFLSYFKNLKVLDISCNNISELAYLSPSLIELVCHGNKLVSIQNHLNITKLDCSENQISSLGDCPNLKDLLVDNNNLTRLRSFPNAHRIVIKNNPITVIDKQLTLAYLDCSSTNICGKLNDMPNLQHLICNNTKIDDINNLTKLISLEILGSAITKVIYIPTLKDLLYKNGDSIALSSRYIIEEHVTEHDNSYVRFQCT